MDPAAVQPAEQEQLERRQEELEEPTSAEISEEQAVPVQELQAQPVPLQYPGTEVSEAEAVDPTMQEPMAQVEQVEPDPTGLLPATTAALPDPAEEEAVEQETAPHQRQVPQVGCMEPAEEEAVLAPVVDQQVPQVPSES